MILPIPLPLRTQGTARLPDSVATNRPIQRLLRPMVTALATTISCLLFGFLPLSGYAETEILVDPLSFPAGGGDPNVELNRQSGTSAPVKYSVLPSDDNPEQIQFSDTGLVITPKPESPEPGILTATSFTQSAELRVSVKIHPLAGGFWGGIVVGCLPDDLNIWENNGFAVRVYSNGAVTLIDRGQQRLITATAPSLSYQVELEIKNPRAFDGSGTAEISVTINGTPLNLEELGAGETIQVDGFRANHIMLTGSTANPPQSPAAEFRDLSVIADPVAFSGRTSKPIPEQTQEAAQFAPIVSAASSNDRQDVIEVKPDFATVVVKGGGLWPQLHCAPDGTLLALGYNAPGHTTLAGDVDCWASTDGGKTWAKRGTAAPRPDKDSNYCDSCSGFAANGDLILLSGGFEDAANAQGKRKPVMPLGVFRSADLGRTWKNEGDFPRELREGVEWRPYGTVVAAPDKTLRTVVYAYRGTEEIGGYMMTSRDDGRSWGEPVIIADKINEGVLLPLAGKGWLCVARTTEKPAPELGQELRQLRSSDDGKTWTDEGLLTGFHKHPPSLIRLKDNRLVLTYGNRQNGNIEARLSNDDGKTWGAPLRLFQASGDMGYPATVQLSDGRMVTVFYAKQSTLHDGYHMAAIGWQAPQEKK